MTGADARFTVVDLGRGFALVDTAAQPPRVYATLRQEWEADALAFINARSEEFAESRSLAAEHHERRLIASAVPF